MRTVAIAGLGVIDLDVTRRLDQEVEGLRLVAVSVWDRDRGRPRERSTVHRPALTLAQDAMSRAVNSDDTSGLTRRERELIVLVVSVENRCTPCVFAHAAALRDATGDTLWVARIEVNCRHADLSARSRALADYAIRITCDPGGIEPADLDKLRQAGVSEVEILDAAGVAAYFNFSNRLNSALGVPPNDEAYAAGR